MVKDVYEFPELDFSALLNPNFDFAVHCSSEEQATHFLKEIRRQYPKNSWAHGNTRWKSDLPIAYSPYINRGRTMTWDSVEHYVKMGFVIVEFEELLPLEHEIDESEFPVDMLFGGESNEQLL